MLAKTISFLLDTGFDDLPQTVVDQTQACLMDLVAVAAAAIPLPEVTQTNRYVQRRHPPLAGASRCHRWAAGKPAPRRTDISHPSLYRLRDRDPARQAVALGAIGGRLAWDAWQTAASR